MTLADQVAWSMEAARRRRRLEWAVRAILARPECFGGAIGRWAAALLAAGADGPYPLLERVAERAA
jgi:hypothetical protein